MVGVTLLFNLSFIFSKLIATWLRERLYFSTECHFRLYFSTEFTKFCLYYSSESSQLCLYFNYLPNFPGLKPFPFVYSSLAMKQALYLVLKDKAILVIAFVSWAAKF